MIQFGIIGCGSAAVPVAQAIASSSKAKLALVYDLEPGLAKDLAGHYGARVAQSLEEILSELLVDAIYIAVPHDLLYPLARQVLQSGKHALVEKPMALTLTQADELISLAEAQGLALGVYYEMQHAGACLTAHRLVQRGAIGRIIAVRIQTLIDKPLSYWQAGYTGRHISPWRGQRLRAGGGVLLMNTSHLLEAVRYVTGLEVERACGETATLVAPVEVEDTAAATLVYANGAIGSILAGAHLAGSTAGDERFDLYGSGGQMRIPDPYSGGSLQVFLREPWEDLPAGVWHTVLTHPVDVHSTAINEYVQAVETRTRPPIDGSVALHILATIRAIYYSSVMHRAVRISEVRNIEEEKTLTG